MIDLSFEDFVEELLLCGWRPVQDENHEKLKTFWQYQKPDGYDASCIKILDDAEALKKTPWLAPETLASKYGKPVDFVKRGLQACVNAEVDINYFIQRYLEGNQDVPKNDAVEYHARILQGLKND